MNNLCRKPASPGHVHAAALAVGGLVAGQKVLIHAAAGGVGHIAVQLAKWRGAQVIGTASASDEAFLRELGVDLFINYRTAAFESVARDVDLVIDAIPREADDAIPALQTVSPLTLRRSLRSLSLRLYDENSAQMGGVGDVRGYQHLECVRRAPPDLLFDLLE